MNLFLAEPPGKHLFQRQLLDGRSSTEGGRVFLSRGKERRKVLSPSHQGTKGKAFFSRRHGEHGGWMGFWGTAFGKGSRAAGCAVQQKRSRAALARYPIQQPRADPAGFPWLSFDSIRSFFLEIEGAWRQNVSFLPCFGSMGMPHQSVLPFPAGSPFSRPRAAASPAPLLCAKACPA